MSSISHYLKSSPANTPARYASNRRFWGKLSLTRQGYQHCLSSGSSSKIDDVLGDRHILCVLLSPPDTGACVAAHAQHVQLVGLGFPSKVYPSLLHVDLNLLGFAASRENPLGLRQLKKRV